MILIKFICIHTLSQFTMHDVFDTIAKENRIRGLIGQKIDDLRDEIMKHIKEMRENDLGYNTEQRGLMKEDLKKDLVTYNDELVTRLERIFKVVEGKLEDLEASVNNLKYDLDKIKESF